MTKYEIKLYSKNKKSLDSFLKLFKRSKNEIQNLQVFLKTLKRKKRQKRITVLKSPHVNKTAQEQFQLVTYQAVVTCFSWEIKKNTLLLKKIKNYLFPDIKMKIEKKNFPYRINLIQNMLLNPENTIYSDPAFFKETTEHKKLLRQTLVYLKILDNYGSLY